MLNLRVTIDSQSGFCFGVIYAIAMAEEILDQEQQLYCLGDIVHNDEEIARLKSKGLQIITHEDLSQLKNVKVLIRAHGEPAATYEMALKNGLELVDASCPVVLKLQNRIKNDYDRSKNIFIYGKHGHAEVVGLMAQTHNEATVFENIGELNLPDLPKKVTLYSQTTKSTEKFYTIKNQLAGSGIEVEANDTICRQVSNKDNELKNFANKFDKVLFVAGAKSSNGRMLYHACKEANQHTYFISKPSDIEIGWLYQNDTVGICGATSTPMWLMEDVKQYLLNL